MVRSKDFVLPAAAFAAMVFVSLALAQTAKKARAPQRLRLYVLDCGRITGVSGDSLGFKPGELANADMITPCYLIAHPRGSMIWDTGEIPDSAFQSGVSPAK